MNFSNATRIHADNQPIVLGHAACTGGSLIYRVILSTFKFRGLSEIGVARVPNPNRYNPWDPEFQFLGQQVISHKEFEEILFKRIIACTQKTQERGERLLLREHTHSFFFNPVCPEIEPSGSSWTSDQFYQKLNIELKGLVSVRDPVDSWLGFRKGFPLQLPRSFDEYCQRYNAYLDRIDQETKHKKNIYLFRYEDLIQDPQKVVDEIANHLNVPHCPVDYSAVGKHVGSGNSGRSSVALSQRPRRPYSLEFLKLASESNEYTKLCQRLGYPQLQDEISLLKKMKATYYSLLNPCLKPVEHLRSRSKKLKSLAQGIGNIQ